MRSKQAIEACVALGQETRLSAYRLLVEVGPRGLPSGEIATRLGIHPSTMSHHLAQLERADLLRSSREDRHILYAVDWNGTNQLLQFLTEDCCKLQPEARDGDLRVKPPGRDAPTALEERQ